MIACLETRIRLKERHVLCVSFELTLWLLDFFGEPMDLARRAAFLTDRVEIAIKGQMI